MNTDDINKSRLLKIKEAAQLLGVHPATLRRWDNEGRLKAVRVGSRSHPINPKMIGDRRYRLEDIKILIQG
jgi:excisionase family DNA binding protein